ncbi:MAG: hypothetical protein ABFS17_13910 [Chloroflexota bacterium]
MTEINEIRELFQRYAEEVGRYLPRRKRKDIQFEILSLLEDALEDQSEQQSVPANEAMALDLLKEYGPPIQYARGYRQDENLISPVTFQLFKPVVILAGLMKLVELVITIGFSIGSPWSVIWPQLAMWAEGIFTTLGILVLAFVSIERTTPQAWLRWPFDQMFADWDPAGLKPSAKKSLINPKEQWFEIVVITALIILFVFFPQWVGIGNNRNGEWSFLPVLAPSFSVYLPWLVSFWLAQLVFLAALSRQIYWDTRMRTWEIGLKIFALGLLIALLTGPPVIGLNPAYIALHNTPANMQTWVSDLTIQTIFYLVVGLNLAVHFVITGRKVFKLLQMRSSMKVSEFPWQE